MNDNHRVVFDYTTFNVLDEASMYSIGLGYDYRFKVNEKIKPFIGLSYTINEYEEDIDSSVYLEDSLVIFTNIIYAKVGIDFEINNNLFISASYDYPVVITGDEIVNGYYFGDYLEATVEFDKISLFRAFIGYKF